jgi:hypothetical protein
MEVDIMSNTVKESVIMLEMLPDSEQDLAYEFIKRLVLAWDPDFTKLTPEELKRLESAEKGEYINAEDIDWDN